MYNRVTAKERLVALLVLIFSLGFGYLAIQLAGSLLTPPKPEYTLVTQPKGGPDYPVPVSRSVNYWAVNCESFVSQETITKVDEILERLNADHIVQTMFLCMPGDQITDGEEYITRFQDYMQLGLPDGPRADNGLAYLFAITDGAAKVNYSVGQGNGALQPWDLRGLADAAQVAPDLDTAMISLAEGIDQYARSAYEPFEPVEPVYGQPSSSEGPSESWIYIILCGGFFFLILVTEPFLAIGTLLGSYWAYEAMAWPIIFLSAISSGSGGSGSGTSSLGGGYRGGGFTGGGGGGRGGRVGGGGGGRTGRAG